MKFLAALFAPAAIVAPAQPVDHTPLVAPIAEPVRTQRPEPARTFLDAAPLDVAARAHASARAGGADQRQAMAAALAALAHADLAPLAPRLNGPHVRASERVSRKKQRAVQTVLLAMAERAA